RDREVGGSAPRRRLCEHAAARWLGAGPARRRRAVSCCTRTEKFSSGPSALTSAYMAHATVVDNHDGEPRSFGRASIPSEELASWARDRCGHGARGSPWLWIQ